MTIIPFGVGVGDGPGVGLGEGDGVGVGVGVEVGEGVGVRVGEGVGVGVGLGVGVGVGVVSHELKGELVLRGLGAAGAKSAELSPLSSQPSPARTIAFVFDGACAAALPSK